MHIATHMHRFLHITNTSAYMRFAALLKLDVIVRVRVRVRVCVWLRYNCGIYVF